MGKKAFVISMYDETSVVRINLLTIKDYFGDDSYTVVVQSETPDIDLLMPATAPSCNHVIHLPDFAKTLPREKIGANCISRNYGAGFSHLYDTGIPFDYIVALCGDTLITDSANFDRRYGEMLEFGRIICISQAIGQDFHAADSDPANGKIGGRLQLDDTSDFMPQFFMIDGEKAIEKRAFSDIKVVNQFTSEQCLGDEFVSKFGDLTSNAIKLSKNAYDYNDGIRFNIKTVSREGFSKEDIKDVKEEDIKTYLKIQNDRYEERASIAIVEKDRIINECVVGTYELQEKFPYDENILKTFDKNTEESVALEYGCGPGRNLLRLSPRFKTVIGVDIGKTNLENARKLLTLNNCGNFELHNTTGDNIPLPDSCADLVFSVICITHICSYTVRSRILNDMVRILRPGGILVNQMGFNNGRDKVSPYWKPNWYVGYYTDRLEVDTNGISDCCVEDENQLLEDYEKRGLKSLTYWFTDGVNDPNHPQWLWCSGKKPE